jgi:hypothetical protein
MYVLKGFNINPTQTGRWEENKELPERICLKFGVETWSVKIAFFIWEPEAWGINIVKDGARYFNELIVRFSQREHLRDM